VDVNMFYNKVSPDIYDFYYPDNGYIRIFVFLLTG